MPVGSGWMQPFVRLTDRWQILVPGLDALTSGIAQVVVVPL
jgi:hypothetical protein